MLFKHILHSKRKFKPQTLLWLNLRSWDGESNQISFLIPPADEQAPLCLPSWRFCKPGRRPRGTGSLTDGSWGCRAIHACGRFYLSSRPRVSSGSAGNDVVLEISICLWRWANKRPNTCAEMPRYAHGRYLCSTGLSTTPCLLNMCLHWHRLDFCSWVKGIKVSSAAIKLKKNAKNPVLA